MGWTLLGENKDKFTDKLWIFMNYLLLMKLGAMESLKQLMKTAIDHLKQNGHTEVRLSTFSGNRAIKLYEKISPPWF